MLETKIRKVHFSWKLRLRKLELPQNITTETDKDATEEKFVLVNDTINGKKCDGNINILLLLLEIYSINP